MHVIDPLTANRAVAVPLVALYFAMQSQLPLTQLGVLMRAEVEAGPRSRPPLSWGVAGYRHSWLLILPALAVGLGAVLHESPGYQMDAATQRLHAAFGLLLWLSVMAQFLLGIRRMDCAAPGAAGCCATPLARQVYLVSYLLAGAKGLQYFAHSTGSGAGLAHSMQALQPYYGYALITLVAVKAAAVAVPSARRS